MLSIDQSLQKKEFWLRTIFRLLLLILGLLQIWAYRNIASTDDAIAYLDIGEAYFKGDWQVALNAYWSPLYSGLLGLALTLIKPPPPWEFFVIKLVNFLMCLFALFSFEFLLRQFIHFYNRKSESISQRHLQIPEWVWLITGYTLFLWSTLRWTPLYSDTPDLCTAALVYLAAGILLRLQIGSSTWAEFIALGGVLGLAFLSKTVMFPLAFIFLAVSACSIGRFQRSLPRVLAALLAFTLVTAPFITAISLTKGHLTIGESGKLNYAWFVTRYVQPFRYWLGDDPSFGTPEHPPRQLVSEPPVFEFATPIGGTYPLWHDPSYWYEGLRFKFSPKGQLRVLVNNLFFYYDLFLGILLFSYLILVFSNEKWRSSINSLMSNWVLLILAIAGLGIYAIGVDLPATNVNHFLLGTRYIAPFIVLLFVGVFSSVQLPNTQEAKKLIGAMALATLIVIVNLSTWVFKDALESKLNGIQRPLQWEVTTHLSQLGIHSGDKVAILGAYQFPNHHWARLARVKIVVEVLDDVRYWKSDATLRARAIDAIAKTGVVAIVQRPGVELPDSALKLGWQKLGTTKYYAYIFGRDVKR
jgi:hypothetical protein